MPLCCTCNEQHPLRFLVVEEIVEGPSTPHTQLDSIHVSLTQGILAKIADVAIHQRVANGDGFIDFGPQVCGEVYVEQRKKMRTVLGEFWDLVEMVVYIVHRVGDAVHTPELVWLHGTNRWEEISAIT